MAKVQKQWFGYLSILKQNKWIQLLLFILIPIWIVSHFGNVLYKKNKNLQKINMKNMVKINEIKEEYKQYANKKSKLFLDVDIVDYYYNINQYNNKKYLFFILNR